MAITTEYENNDLLVVSKPAGIPVYSVKRRTKEESVVSWFVNRYPEAATVGEPERPGVVHRLDRQTSGLLLLAKTPQAYKLLKGIFHRREIRKEYLALVYGLIEKHGIIEKALTKIGHRGSSRVRVDSSGKLAITEYWPKAHYRLGLDQFTLLRVKLHTGRTHQIRVHFSSVNHPVMGDDLYGKPHSQILKKILPRQFLHANRVELRLLDGTWLEVESELPEELEKVLKQLVPEQA